MKVVVEYVHLARVFFRVFLDGRCESKSQQKTLPEGAKTTATDTLWIVVSFLVVRFNMNIPPN